MKSKQRGLALCIPHFLLKLVFYTCFYR